jgi:hypothetical protein
MLACSSSSDDSTEAGAGQNFTAAQQPPPLTTGIYDETGSSDPNTVRSLLVSSTLAGQSLQLGVMDQKSPLFSETVLEGDIAVGQGGALTLEEKKFGCKVTIERPTQDSLQLNGTCQSPGGPDVHIAGAFKARTQLDGTYEDTPVPGGNVDSYSMVVEKTDKDTFTGSLTRKSDNSVMYRQQSFVFETPFKAVANDTGSTVLNAVDSLLTGRQLEELWVFLQGGSLQVWVMGSAGPHQLMPAATK